MVDKVSRLAKARRVMRDEPGRGARGLRPAWAGLLLAVVLSLGLTNCTIFRPARPLSLPAGFLSRPEAAQLANPRTRQAAYARLFTPMPKLQLSGNLVASSRWWRGKEHFQVSFLALEPNKESSPPALRLRGYLQQMIDPLFDVIVRDDLMTVVFPPAKKIFQGVIPPTGSPFGRRYGVEPWDLVPVLTIGQQIANGSFRAEQEDGSIALRPTNKGAVKGFERILLDRQSGLPKQATLKTGGTTYTIRYLGWDDFTDSLTGEETRLMPSRVEIERKAPHTLLRLTVDKDKYQFNNQVSEKLFMIYVDPSYPQAAPLEDLNKVLED